MGGVGSWYFLNDDFTGQANTALEYGNVDDEVYVADTDGDGVDTLLIRRGFEFFVRNSLSTGVADETFLYGDVGDTVLVGDWDGDGTDTLAVRRGNQYFIKNSLTTGVADEVVHYGNNDDTVLVGDWDADGVDTLAVRRGNHYFIKDSISSGVADQEVFYGNNDDEVIVGAWSGEADSLGVRRGNTYFLQNELSSGVADVVFDYGNVDDTVLVGDWNADGIDSLGVRRVTGPEPGTDPVEPEPQVHDVALSLEGDSPWEESWLNSAVPVAAGSQLRLVLPQGFDYFVPEVPAGAELLTGPLQPQEPGVWTTSLRADLSPGSHDLRVLAWTNDESLRGAFNIRLEVVADGAPTVDVTFDDISTHRTLFSEVTATHGDRIRVTAPEGFPLTNPLVLLGSSDQESAEYLDPGLVEVSASADGSTLTLTVPDAATLETLNPLAEGYRIEILQPNLGGSAVEPHVIRVTFELFLNVS